MISVVSTELSKALRNPWLFISLAIGCMLAILSAWQYVPIYEFTPDSGRFYYPDSQGCFQSWMSLSATSAPMLFYQLLPLLAVTPYACSLASEFKDGYIAQTYTRTSRGAYLAAKYIAVGISAGLVAVLPQVLNLVFLACVHPAYLPNVTMAMYYGGVFWDNIGSWFYYNVPILYVALYCGIDFALCGLWACFVLSLSLLIRNRVLLLTLPYLGLLALAFVNERIFFALGGIRGFDLSLFENLHGFLSAYRQDGWIILAECFVLALLSVGILALFRKRDVL